MASTYQRRQQWWIQFQHPGTKKFIRESLQTSSASRAALLCKRIELEVALLEPRFQAVELPSRIREEIGISAAGSITTTDAAVTPSPVPAIPVPAVAVTMSAAAGRKDSDIQMAFLKFI